METFNVKKNDWHFKLISWRFAMKNYFSGESVKTDYSNWKKYYNKTDYSEWMIENNPSQIPVDFCSYWRAVILWPLIDLIIVLTALFIIISVSFVSSKVTMSVLIGFFVFAIILAFFGLILYVIDKMRTRRKEKKKELATKDFLGAINNEPSNDGFFKRAYKSFKGKYCHQVRIEDK